MNARKIFNLIMSLIIILSFVGIPTRNAHAAGPLCYVNDSATGANDGTLWMDAYTDLQSALADEGCTKIWVAAGIYKPTSSTDRAISFVLKNGVSIYGGFAGTETQLEQRNWVTNETILSGDLNGDDEGFANNEENSYHVVAADETDSSAVLDGVTIRGGNAGGNYGGGMYNRGSSPTLTHVTFNTNSASLGGGMSNYNSNLMMVDVTFSDNRATYWGGGMYSEFSSPTLTDVTFNGNTASYRGGGVYNDIISNPTLTSVTFSGNTAGDSGGGMSNHVSNPTLTDVTFSSNSAAIGGGMYNWNASPVLIDVTFNDNTATASGGGMLNWSGGPKLTNVTFNGNTSSSGGGMSNDACSPTLTNVTFSNNTASYLGGGMHNYNGSNPELTGVTFNSNTAAEGGGISNWDSSPTLTNITFTGNTTTVYGGGMDNVNSSPMLTNVIFSNNSATERGGGMFNGSSNALLMDVTFNENTAAWGGGIFNQNSAPVLTDVTFTTNIAHYGGGMRSDYSSPGLTNVTFSGNSASAGGGMYNQFGSTVLTDVNFNGNSASVFGGGMYNLEVDATLTSVTISSNTAAYGGGLHNETSNPTLTNVTFSGNSATSWGGGMNNSHSSPELMNATFSHNTAVFMGGGIYNYDSAPQLINAILWGDGVEVSGDVSSLPVITNSIVQGSCPVGATCTNIINADPKLGPLADNGGFTQTHALLRGSSAIEAADPASCPATDQRGVTRPQAARCDIGAYELVIENNFEPIATAGGPYYTYPGNSITLDASASSDPDGDALSYEWDLDYDGQYDDSTGVTTTTVFNQIGEYTIGLRVTETFGLTSTDTATVMVSPRIDARFHENEIHGYEWPLGDSVTVTIDDPDTPQPVDYTDTQTVVISDVDPNLILVRFELGDFELENGQIVTMSDGTTTKTHVVAVPTITDVRSWKVEGLTEPSAEIWIEVAGAIRHETADSTGHWLADFHVPGDEDWETQTANIGWFTEGEARFQDEDGDSTSTNWGRGILMLELDSNGRPMNLYIRHWPGRSQITTMIDDPASPQNPDYTDIRPIYWSDGRSHMTIDWTGVFDVRPGFTITVTDGYIAKSMVVPLLAITGYDLANDTISGVSDPLATIRVPVSHATGPEWVEPSVTADDEGHWVANLRVPSYPDNEIYNLLPGDSAEPQTYEADWDHTVLRDWSIPFDIDGDGAPDVLDPCADDATNTCDQAGSAAGVIGVEGGVLTTENGKVTLNVPPNSLGNDFTLSITDKDGGYELASDQGPMAVVQSYSIQPHGTQFDPSVSITLRWADEDDNSIVDGTAVQESNLRLIKDGLVITPACSENPDCNMVTNELTVQVSDLSLFALAVPIEWTLKGFYQPVDMNGVYNIVKNGSTVPLKFEIFVGSTELTDTADLKSLTYAQTSCDANAITDEIESTASGGTGLRYDATAGQFVYNWKTPNIAGKCYRVTMSTVDGSSLVAYFKLK